ncbi:Ig domain-containing protein [Chloroflexus aggregans]|uniref:Ig domain-containing protein n=1 Tax=Chloroflexus aggregans TaxID=152260 RepID=UPI0026B7183C
MVNPPDHGNGTATLTGAPTTPGDYEVVLRVTDNSGLSAEQRFTITVTRARWAVFVPMITKLGASTGSGELLLPYSLLPIYPSLRLNTQQQRPPHCAAIVDPHGTAAGNSAEWR